MSAVSFEEILSFAQVSLDSYLPLSEIKDKYGDSLLALGEEKKHDVRYFMFKHDGGVFLAFRGTADLENALTDGEYGMRFDKELGVYVHVGFQSAYKCVAQALEHQMESVIASGLPIRITGHSLGGAVAVLALIHLSLTPANLKSVITFGQPKVTGKNGPVKFRELPLLRIVDKEDLVPLVPPLTLGNEIHGGYHHFGRELLLLDGDYYCLLEERVAEEYKVSSFWENICHESFKDHYMTNYIKGVNAKVLKSRLIPYDDRKKYE